MKIIAKTIFGSRLYGTSIPSSDTDYKVIYIDDLRDIVLGKHTPVKRSESDLENSETEFIEFRKFIKDLIGGQTYAIDMLFTPENMVIESSDLFKYIRKNKKQFITKNIKAFIGYCITQARVYSNKGQRINKINEILSVVEGLDQYTTLKQNQELLASHMNLVEKSFRRSGKDLTDEYFELYGKFYQTNINVKELVQRLKEVIKHYGARAHAATYDGKDWKAIYHAFRCIWELKELANTGQIQFPLKRKDELLQIRQGTWEDFKPERLEWEMGSVECDVRYSSHTKDTHDQTWIDNLLLKAYGVNQEVEPQPYPHSVCSACGQKHMSDKVTQSSASTYHSGFCPVCQTFKPVTQPRDFGYPEFPGFQKGLTEVDIFATL